MIKLFSDTSANLPSSIVKEYNIKILPFSYSINGVPVPYYEGIDFDGVTFYQNQRNGADVKTTLVSSGVYEEAFEEEISKGNAVLYVGMSGGISGSANSARLAKEEIMERHPGCQIETIDTYAASMGEGLQVIDAAEMIKEGKSFDEIVKTIYFKRDYMCQYFTVDDLQYLRKTGRVSNATAFIGNVLSIKPILTGDETGHIIVIDKVRGLKNALKNITDRFAQLIADKASTISIAHCDNLDGANFLLEKLREVGFTGFCHTVLYEPVTGSHVGPGTIALFFYGTKKFID